jgi:hypothetical protein
LALALAACSASGDGSENNTGTYTAGTGGQGGGLFTTGGGSSVGGGTSDGCSDAARLIYVLTDTNQLYSFKPDEKLFTLIGPLQCATSMQPNSMAVDRSATAWVNYVQNDGFVDTGGALFKVSTADASCEPAPVVNLPAGWFRIGMGYSTDGLDGDAETLFVASINGGSGLGRIEGANLVDVGSFGGAFSGQNAELTGTGDARLFAFFTSTPVEVGELNKSNGQVMSSVPLPTVEVPFAWAFSFWGGDFYLYTAGLAGNSRVNRYRPSDGTVDTSYMPNVGFRIVGAGVSTCAPVSPPN